MLSSVEQFGAGSFNIPHHHTSKVSFTLAKPELAEWKAQISSKQCWGGPKENSDELVFKTRLNEQANKQNNSRGETLELWYSKYLKVKIVLLKLCSVGSTIPLQVGASGSASGNASGEKLWRAVVCFPLFWSFYLYLWLLHIFLSVFDQNNLLKGCPDFANLLYATGIISLKAPTTCSLRFLMSPYLTMLFMCCDPSALTLVLSKWVEDLRP